ncbi:hypothetical protein [Rhizobium sp. CSW-27]|uniref:hypothetical protein n=1 Tax=Rhizobium sp. CSW-27 TaxID=2839985 RepID=UPI001C02E304|nr:hypothetical protein [Rhizobium sp. CSW-27]MBT9369943.1 hypothetical protein [Rhizobium sp. CSW-27]
MMSLTGSFQALEAFGRDSLKIEGRSRLPSDNCHSDLADPGRWPKKKPVEHIPQAPWHRH